MDRVIHPVGSTIILEQEEDWVQGAIDDGFDLGNRRYFYNSPAVEIDEALISHRNE